VGGVCGVDGWYDVNRLDGTETVFMTFWEGVFYVVIDSYDPGNGIFLHFYYCD